MDLTCRHGSREAVKRASLACHGGTLTALLGPNGAGKSTLLHALAGLYPYEGAVRVSGRNAATLSRRELARQVAIVLQDPPTDVPFTVAELVLMGRAPHLGRLGLEGPRDLGIAEAAMRHTDVLGLSGRPIDQLSGGEKRRALLARALAQEPKVLLLDEPTAFLDLGHQANLMEHCRALLAQGMCIVCVLHDPNLAVAWADEVALMDRGEIVAQGAARAVLSGERLEALYGASLLKTLGPSGEGPFFSPRRRP